MLLLVWVDLHTVRAEIYKMLPLISSHTRAVNHNITTVQNPHHKCIEQSVACPSLQTILLQAVKVNNGSKHINHAYNEAL